MSGYLIVICFSCTYRCLTCRTCPRTRTWPGLRTPSADPGGRGGRQAHAFDLFKRQPRITLNLTGNGPVRPIQFCPHEANGTWIRCAANRTRCARMRYVHCSRPGEPRPAVSALVERLHRDLPDARWSWSMCDGLFTPRPLGPLFDLADQFGGALLERSRAGARVRAVPADRREPVLRDRVAAAPAQYEERCPPRSRPVGASGRSASPAFQRRFSVASALAASLGGGCDGRSPITRDRGLAVARPKGDRAA